MRERLYVAALAPSTGASVDVDSACLSSSPPARSRTALEEYVERAALPLPPLVYVGLSLVASFCIFVMFLEIGRIAAVTAGVMSVYLLVVFTPRELFGRRIAKLQCELPEVCRSIGSTLLEGTSLERALTRSYECAQSSELQALLRDARRRLLVSGSLSGLREAVGGRGYGVVVLGFLAALQCAALRSRCEAGTMCVAFARTLETQTAIVQRHARRVRLVRLVGLLLILSLCAWIYGSGVLSEQAETGSLLALAREVGGIAMILALTALWRVTSLVEWYCYEQ